MFIFVDGKNWKCLATVLVDLTEFVYVLSFVKRLLTNYDLWFKELCLNAKYKLGLHSLASG